eukprot:g689.t1
MFSDFGKKNLFETDGAGGGSGSAFGGDFGSGGAFGSSTGSPFSNAPSSSGAFGNGGSPFGGDASTGGSAGVFGFGGGTGGGTPGGFGGNVAATEASPSPSSQFGVVVSVLQNFYENIVQKSKSLEEINNILKKYKGHERVLVDKLKKKYGNSQEMGNLESSILAYANTKPTTMLSTFSTPGTPGNGTKTERGYGMSSTFGDSSTNVFAATSGADVSSTFGGSGFGAMNGAGDGTGAFGTTDGAGEGGSAAFGTTNGAGDEASDKLTAPTLGSALDFGGGGGGDASGMFGSTNGAGDGGSGAFGTTNGAGDGGSGAFGTTDGAGDGESGAFGTTNGAVDGASNKVTAPTLGSALDFGGGGGDTSGMFGSTNGAGDGGSGAFGTTNGAGDGESGAFGTTNGAGDGASDKLTAPTLGSALDFGGGGGDTSGMFGSTNGAGDGGSGAFGTTNGAGDGGSGAFGTTDGAGDGESGAFGTTNGAGDGASDKLTATTLGDGGSGAFGTTDGAGDGESGAFGTTNGAGDGASDKLTAPTLGSALDFGAGGGDTPGMFGSTNGAGDGGSGAFGTTDGAGDGESGAFGTTNGAGDGASDKLTAPTLGSALDFGGGGGDTPGMFGSTNGAGSDEPGAFVLTNAVGGGDEDKKKANDETKEGKESKNESAGLDFGSSSFHLPGSGSSFSPAADAKQALGDHGSKPLSDHTSAAFQPKFDESDVKEEVDKSSPPGSFSTGTSSSVSVRVKSCFESKEVGAISCVHFADVATKTTDAVQTIVEARHVAKIKHYGFVAILNAFGDDSHRKTIEHVKRNLCRVIGEEMHHANTMNRRRDPNTLNMVECVKAGCIITDIEARAEQLPDGVIHGSCEGDTSGCESVFCVATSSTCVLGFVGSCDAAFVDSTGYCGPKKNTSSSTRLCFGLYKDKVVGATTFASAKPIVDISRLSSKISFLVLGTSSLWRAVAEDDVTNALKKLSYPLDGKIVARTVVDLAVARGAPANSAACLVVDIAKASK